MSTRATDTGGVEMPATQPPAAASGGRPASSAAAAAASQSLPGPPALSAPGPVGLSRPDSPQSVADDEDEDALPRQAVGSLSADDPDDGIRNRQTAPSSGRATPKAAAASRFVRQPPSPLNRIHYLNPASASASNLSTLSHPLQRSPAARQPSGQSAGDLEESRVAMLLSAASRGNVDRILSLLQAGLSPNACDYDRRTALHVACSDGSLETVKVLIEEGADINRRDRFGHTPLDEAVSYQHGDIAELLMFYHAEHGAIEKLEAQLITSAASNNLPAARALLASGVSANCFDYDRRTPLHLSVTEGHTEMSRLLLSYGANPMAEDRWGSSPLTELQRRLTRTGQDPMREVFAHLLKERQASEAAPFLSNFACFYLLWEIVIVCLMGGFANYDAYSGGNSGFTAEQSELSFLTVYPLYQDVHVMIFIGFAYLMVFLRKHGYTSVGVTFLVAAFVLQWYQLTRGFWSDTFAGSYSQILISVQTLVRADFCAGAVLITFGVVLGKVSPSQMLLVSLLETAAYSLNEQIGLTLQVADLGGTITIHMFGAFFGIALSKVVTPRAASGNQNNASVYHSDIMAMIGSIFLWIFWPSFNAALGVGNTQARAVINTVLSIAASCVTAFLASYSFRRDRRFNMVDVQNATLAGGVAMGACCDMLILPGSAMAIGAAAGVVSVLGFVYVQPWLEERIGLHDTCGVNNLHGMPSLVGGVASIIASAVAADSSYDTADLTNVWGSYRAGGRSAGVQAAMQLAYMGSSIGIGLAAGFITGLFARLAFFEPPAEDDTDGVFQDSLWWEVPHLELPYYFDRRGEISRGAGNLAQVNMGVSTGGVAAAESGLQGGDLKDKAKYQRLLESKLDALEQQVYALKKQSRNAAANGYPPLQQQQPASPPLLPVAAAEQGRSPSQPQPTAGAPPPPHGGYPYLYPGYAPAPFPYYPYPQLYSGPSGHGGYAGWQPTNNHNPIIPPDVAYPVPMQQPLLPSASALSSSSSSPAAHSQLESLMSRLLSRMEQGINGAGSGAARTTDETGAGYKQA